MCTSLLTYLRFHQFCCGQCYSSSNHLSDRHNHREQTDDWTLAANWGTVVAVELLLPTVNRKLLRWQRIRHEACTQRAQNLDTNLEISNLFTTFSLISKSQLQSRNFRYNLKMEKSKSSDRYFFSILVALIHISWDKKTAAKLFYFSPKPTARNTVASVWAGVRHQGRRLGVSSFTQHCMSHRRWCVCVRWPTLTGRHCKHFALARRTPLLKSQQSMFR